MKPTPTQFKCLNCNKEQILPRWKTIGKKFCSHKCEGKYNSLHSLNSGLFTKGITAHNKGVPQTKEQKENNRLTHLGKTSFWKNKNLPRAIVNKMRITKLKNGSDKRTEIQNKRLSATIQGVSLEEWNGFISSEREKECNSKEWNVLRKSIFERDDYTCQECYTRGCRLEVHHIKEWINYPDLRMDETNLITLCKDCHNQTKKGAFTNINYERGILCQI